MRNAKKTILLFAVVALYASASGRADRGFVALNPGGPANYEERLPVQIVFVGYTRAQVNESVFRSQLAAAGDPIVRARAFYDVMEPVGIHYDYDYTITYASAGWENNFFARLASLAVPESSVDGRTRTLYQDAYNLQAKRKATIGINWFIDGPSVEKWLQEHAPDGIDSARNTVYFINWFGRADFRFHTYTKIGEPDPDTGYDFGLQRQTRKLIAWGGTPASDRETGFGTGSRTWFYDLSAGPEAWSNNWNITDEDVDGDSVADNRMPPTWEYFANGYKKKTELARDLGLVARYIAVNLLFAPSPLYPPYLTPRRLPGSINLDVNFFDMLPSLGARNQYQKPQLFVRNTSILHRVKYDFDDQQMRITKGFTRCYLGWLTAVPCYPPAPYPAFANLFLYSAIYKDTWRDGHGESRQYEAGLFNYVTDDDHSPALLGYADDNWIDGTQSGVFSFISPGVIAAGYGLTSTMIHEYGHHTGMSHPHDGYDSETGVDYGPGGFFQFVWTGDEVNSMMSYIDLNWDFSQFDLDNTNRWQAAAYLKMANSIAATILRSGHGDGEGDDNARGLRRADLDFAHAQAAFSAHDYAAAFDYARRGYQRVLAAAEEAGVQVRASDHGWDLLPPLGEHRDAKRAYAYMNILTPNRRDPR